VALFVIRIGMTLTLNEFYDVQIEAENADEADAIAATYDSNDVRHGALMRILADESEPELGEAWISTKAVPFTNDQEADTDSDGDASEEDDESAGCRTDGCSGRMGDGEGYDGYCGNCADRRDNSEADAQTGPRYACLNFPKEHTKFRVRAYESHLFAITDDGCISKEPISDSYESDEIGIVKCVDCLAEADDRRPDDSLEYE